MTKRVFELVALSNSPDDDSPMRKRLEAAFDRFIDYQTQKRCRCRGAYDRNGDRHRHRPQRLYRRRPAGNFRASARAHPGELSRFERRCRAEPPAHFAVD
jgi:hypothetical protein